METQAPTDNLQLQSRRAASRQQYTRGNVVPQPQQDRVAVQDSTPLNSTRALQSPTYGEADGRSKDDIQEAHQIRSTTQAANPFEYVSPPKTNEWGTAPSRGGYESYKGDDQDRLFEGGGRREIPDGLRKKAEEEREQPGGEDGMGREGDDKDGDSNDDRDDWEEGLVPVEELDEDDDDGLKGYVDAEDDAAYDEWLKDDDKSNGKSLSKEDFLKRRDKRWAEIMKHAEEQNTKEDIEWLEGVKSQVYLIQSSFSEGLVPAHLDQLVAMLRYQPSRRLANFRTSPAAMAMQSMYVGWISLHQREPYRLGACNHAYLHVQKHIQCIFGQESYMEEAVERGQYDAIYTPENCPPLKIQRAGREISVNLFKVPLHISGLGINNYIDFLAVREFDDEGCDVWPDYLTLDYETMET